MSRYDGLSEEELDEILRFIEKTDIDIVSDDLRQLVEKRWPWLLPQLPIKGEPIPALWPLLYYALLVNGAWGFSTTLFLKVFGSARDA